MEILERLAGSIMLAWGWRRAAIAAAAGASAVLAMPPFDVFAAMFLALPVLVWLLDGASGNPDRGMAGRLWPAFVTGWWFGFGYFVAGLWWLGTALLVDADAFAWAIPLAVLALPAFLALFFGLGASVARVLWSDGYGRVLALAFGLTLSEWLRGFVLTGFPWNTLGYAAMPVPLAMQSAHALGLLGVTALSIVVFATPALMATRQGMTSGVIVALCLVAGHLGYGAFALRTPPAVADEAGPVIRIVQPSIEQEAKWSESERDTILARTVNLTASPPPTGTPRASLVVWPETAVPFFLTEAPNALAAIAGSLDEGQQLATGVVRLDESGPVPRYYNSITVVGDDGEIRDAADKVHLVPFGEYVPFAAVLERLGISTVAEIPEGFSAASERTLLSIGELRALPLICYEAIFPFTIPADAPTPDFALNVTNDAWYGATPGPYQHFRQAQLRAAEARLPLVRAANNGISAIVDGHGRIVDGLALDATGVVHAPLPARPASKWDTGDRQRNLWLLLLVLLAGAIASKWRFRRR